MFEIYDKMKFDDYRQLPGLHASSLKHALTSPLAYHHAETNGWPDSDTYRLGRAGHTAILEPQRFMSDYAVYETTHPDGSKRIRSGKAWEEFKAANVGKTILTPTQFEIAIKLRDIVRDHPVAGPIVRRAGRRELSLRWTHGRTGAVCKSRLDLATVKEITDIKLTNDPRPEKFQPLAERLFYRFQGAFYRDAAEACGLGRLPFKIIAIQDNEPHDVWVYVLDDDILADGQELYEEAIEIVQACREKQEWPGAAVTHEVPLLRPAWAAMRVDSEPITFGEEAIG